MLVAQVLGRFTGSAMLLSPRNTLRVSKQLYNTEEKAGGLSESGFSQILGAFPSSFLRRGSILPKGHQQCSITCKGWMDLHRELRSYIYKVFFNQKAQNAITNAISLILMRCHTFRLQETEDLYVVGFDPLMCHDKEINLKQPTHQVEEVI